MLISGEIKGNVVFLIKILYVWGEFIGTSPTKVDGENLIWSSAIRPICKQATF